MSRAGASAPRWGWTLLALATSACGGASEGGGPGGEVVAVRVSPAAGQVGVGESLQLAAVALDADQQPVSGAAITWGSAEPGIATVSGAGLVTGVTAGTVTITAAVGAEEGSAAVEVVPAGVLPAILLAAGDIASCDRLSDEATAALLDTLPGAIAALGDNAYPKGTLREYNTCYGPSWGRHKARTRPAVGNHEYLTTGAQGHWSYWGAAAGPAGKGWYSYDLGAWHIVVLNSNCAEVACTPGSEQEQWLRADLAAHAAGCTLAYWHHPRFSSGAAHGSDSIVQPFWEALHEAGTEIVLNGHEHIYERFAPQDPDGAADPTAGIRQFTVGTGGRMPVQIGTIRANSEVRHTGSYGVLELTLGDGNYSWRFVPALGSPLADMGSGSCH